MMARTRRSDGLKDNVFGQLIQLEQIGADGASAFSSSAGWAAWSSYTSGPAPRDGKPVCWLEVEVRLLLSGRRSFRVQVRWRLGGVSVASTPHQVKGDSGRRDGCERNVGHGTDWRRCGEEDSVEIDP